MVSSGAAWTSRPGLRWFVRGAAVLVGLACMVGMVAWWVGGLYYLGGEGGSSLLEAAPSVIAAVPAGLLTAEKIVLRAFEICPGAATGNRYGQPLRGRGGVGVHRRGHRGRDARLCVVPGRDAVPRDACRVYVGGPARPGGGFARVRVRRRLRHRPGGGAGGGHGPRVAAGQTRGPGKRRSLGHPDRLFGGRKGARRSPSRRRGSPPGGDALVLHRHGPIVQTPSSLLQDSCHAFFR